MNNMNRRQRREQEKRLGITKYRKSMGREQRFEMIRNNVLEGKKKEREMKEVRRLQEQQGQDNIDSQKVIQEAQQISQNENIPFIDALDKAQSNQSK